MVTLTYRYLGFESDSVSFNAVKTKRTTDMGTSTQALRDDWELSRSIQRLAIQYFFAELMPLFCIYGANINKDAKNTEFSCIIDIIPLHTDKYALFIVQHF